MIIRKYNGLVAGQPAYYEISEGGCVTTIFNEKYVRIIDEAIAKAKRNPDFGMGYVEWVIENEILVERHGIWDDIDNNRGYII